MPSIRYMLWRMQALYDTKRIQRRYAVREWWERFR